MRIVSPKTKILVVLFIIPVLIISSFVYSNYIHWSSKEIDDNSTIPLNKSVDSIKDGLPFANSRANKWRQDAVLTKVVAVFEGKERIKNRKGVIKYGYFVKNNSIFGLPQVVCWVDIDMEKQSLVHFNSYGGKNLEFLPTSTPSDIDINYMFDMIEKNHYSELINQHSNPKVIIRAYSPVWDLAIYPNSDSSSEDTVIKFDTSTKDIIKVQSFKK